MRRRTFATSATVRCNHRSGVKPITSRRRRCEKKSNCKNGPIECMTTRRHTCERFRVHRSASLVGFGRDCSMRSRTHACSSEKSLTKSRENSNSWRCDKRTNVNGWRIKFVDETNRGEACCLSRCLSGLPIVSSRHPRIRQTGNDLRRASLLLFCVVMCASFVTKFAFYTYIFLLELP